ncbi:adenylate/guanylate cyclase domain-containing protein [Methanocella sp. MCL-LM]|uniref:adenylate/guanylate cyclase domain-containing protein n=1 Tax=Methanocella sp. MCL-LM TaxID=3412035 RepID=UPI003C78F6FF
MSWVSDLGNKVNDYLDGDYDVSDTDSIPSVEQVPHGKKAKKMRMCAYCIDMRRSSDLLSIHQKQTCGKIHKAFLTIATETVQRNGGYVRSFNGDGLLAFWPTSGNQISQAVKAAFETKYLINTKFSPLFEKYSKIDFGIGIDYGDVYIVRAGLPRNDNNNDLVFIGKCVNFATAISNQAKSPGHIEVSEATYNALDYSWQYGKQNGVDVNMWTDGAVEWKSEKHKTKVTQWHATLE